MGFVSCSCCGVGIVGLLLLDVLIMECVNSVV